MIEPELSAHQRAALRAWAERDVPADFADEVFARWDAELTMPPVADSNELDAPLVPRTRGAISADDRDVATHTAERRDVRLAWWCGMMAAAAAILLALAMAWPRAAHRHPSAEASNVGEPTPELIALRSAAHEHLLANCSPCHLGRSDGAKPAALAIFDLDDPRWHDALSGEQLRGATERMADKATPEEAAGFRRYVVAELSHRHRGR